jgi:membrane-bound serine protease (ClpP class)
MSHPLRTWQGRIRTAALLLLAMVCALPLSIAGAAAVPASQPAAVPAFRKADHVAILTIDGPVEPVTLKSIERRIAQARRDGADAIVIEINTFGGDMAATLDICAMIERDAPANTVAWINPKAYSAGTIIALTCREVVVAPHSTFGDAAPIQFDNIQGLIQMAPAERAKAETPLLQRVIDSARRNHYDEKLVQAFVSVGIELWMIENVTTGERVFVDRAEYQDVFGKEPPTQMTSVTPVMASGMQRPIAPMFSSLIPDAQPQELDPDAIAAEIEREQSLPPARQPLTAADRQQWKLVGQVKSGDRLLTVNQNEAVYFGLASAVIANDEQLKAFFGAQSIRRYDQSWSEHLVSFLMNFWVRVILIIVFLVALFAEMASPGMGVFGASAIVAMLLLIGAPWLVGMAQWWQLLLILVGVLLILVELFVLPGVGAPGIVGVVCLLAGLVGTFMSDDLSSPQGQSELWTGLIGTMTALFGAGVAMWLISRHLHSIPVINRLILKTELGADSGAGGAGLGLLEAMGAPQRALAPGDVGTAVTDLRPAGRADFAGKIADVKSVGSFVERGRSVRVVSVGRFAIEVEDAEA